MSTPSRWIAALTDNRPTRRQIARALSSGGFDVRFIDQPAQLDAELSQALPALLMLDADNVAPDVIEAALERMSDAARHVPVVLLSLGGDKGGLLGLLKKHEIANLIAKHGAIRAAHPVLDERELLVTCMKVVSGDIFGIDKYIGGWGIDLRKRAVRSMADKRTVCDEFEQFLANLEAPKGVVPNVVTAAEELILNAMVHAPRDASGKPKYEDIGPVPDLTLQPGEEVTVCWGCDGQRLMLSVGDNFGTLHKGTVLEYIARSFSGDKLVPESKTSGAGLGLSMAFMTIHQLVFNVWDSRRTEAIAGWYLRVANAVEFRQVGKSLNLFWLPTELPANLKAPVAETAAPPSPAQPQAAPRSTRKLSGRLDENSDLSALTNADAVDLRDVITLNSRGVARWIAALKQRRSSLQLAAIPDALVKLASEVEGLLEHCDVVSCALPYYCDKCDREQIRVTDVSRLDLGATVHCDSCGAKTSFSGIPEAYESLRAPAAPTEGRPAQLR